MCEGSFIPSEIGAQHPVAAGARAERPRRLLLCLDGVPHQLIETAKARGLFDSFHSPSRLLSPFPTLTNVGLSAMLGATPPPGYEGLYFDREARELRGGIRKYIGRRTPDKMPSSYMKELDYQEPLHFEFLIYVATDKIWRADMQRFRERFAATAGTRDFFGFLKATDGLLHIRGPERLLTALESLDQILKEIQSYCGEETEIILFSDHGMNLQRNRRSHLQNELKRRGFVLGPNLPGTGRSAIAIPAFGLCGYAALYCADEESAPAVAEAIDALEGVDFSVRRDMDDTVIVEGPGGRARIERRSNASGVSYRYHSESGDPLQLNSVREQMQAGGEIDQ